MLPVIPAFKRFLAGVASRKWLLASAAAVALAAPAAVVQAAPNARDDHFDRRDNDRRDFDHRDWRDNDRHDNDHRDNDRHDHDGNRFNLDIRFGNPGPRFEERQVRVWVPPVYRTVVDRKWIEPVYRTECEQVWVPDRYEDRQVRYNDHGRICTRIERVLVAPGHFESRERQVCVTPGRWENCERQELVCAGHYEVRTERVRVAGASNPFAVVNAQIGGLFGR